MLTLVVDASVLVGELLRRRGRDLLTHPELELHVTEAQWSETRHELGKRLEIIMARQGLPPAAVQPALEVALRVAAQAVVVAPDGVLASLEWLALGRIPADPQDWPTVALALALEVGIWTQDRDFFGCGLPTWSTAVLMDELGLP